MDVLDLIPFGRVPLLRWLSFCSLFSSAKSSTSTTPLLILSGFALRQTRALTPRQMDAETVVPAASAADLQDSPMVRACNRTRR